MFKNYLKIALRTLRRNKVYSFINITGLAISIAACLLILQYVSFELSYDTFHANADNLYRLTNDRHQNGQLTQHGVITYPSVPKAMKADYPEVVNYTRLIQNRVYLRHGETGFDESIVYADSAFLSMFSFPLLLGEAKTALAPPNSILLSESSAKKYFGGKWREQEILGKLINRNNRVDQAITGVFKDVPANSHIKLDFLVSYSTFRQTWPQAEDSWTNSNFMVYLQLAPGTDPKALEKKFTAFSERYFQGTKVTNSLESFYLQSLKDIHLYSDYEYETWAHGNGTAVWTLLMVAGFILLIAWVNYINLTTARSLERAKEAGVRKVVGARKRQLVEQLAIESLLFNLLGLMVAIMLIELSRPFISEKLGIYFSSAFSTGRLGLAFIALFLLGTLASALYPGFLLSSFETISVLKGKLTRSARGYLMRRSLVVFQFVMSFVLIAGTYAVYSQIDFMLHQNLGMNISQTLVINGPRLTRWDSTYYDHINSFKAELLRYPAISSVTASQRLPGRRTGRIFDLQRKGGDPAQRYTTSEIGVDYQFFETFEMPILAGRGFGRSDHNMDFNAIKTVVINATAAKLLGFEKPEAAIQQGLRYWGKEWEIAGVVADHHQQSLHVPVEPIIFMPLYSTSNFFFVKLQPRNLEETIAAVQGKYLEFFPGNSFSHFFLDDYFNAQYQTDRRFGAAFGLFAGLGVLLACLGLFGLSFFTTAQRTKEIGVRKVLGASTGSIWGLLSKDYSKLVLLAALLASPATYFAVSRWLAGYAYRIDLGWPIFLVSTLIVLAVALLTVSYQTIKAALANPVEALRYE
ncbi:ABC transporter permease [candidate division KSB1 bacterium]|nr:ABC transporter permease [candidate division KSB1 bacterium]